MSAAVVGNEQSEKLTYVRVRASLLILKANTALNFPQVKYVKSANKKMPSHTR